MDISTPNGAQALPRLDSSIASADLKRRRFLFTLGASGVSAAAVAVAAVPGASAGVTATLPRPDDGSGYRETEHVRDYYRTARI